MPVSLCPSRGTAAERGDLVDGREFPANEVEFILPIKNKRMGARVALPKLFPASESLSIPRR
jgi:hypothetical protein